MRIEVDQLWDIAERMGIGEEEATLLIGENAAVPIGTVPDGNSELPLYGLRLAYQKAPGGRHGRCVD